MNSGPFELSFFTRIFPKENHSLPGVHFFTRPTFSSNWWMMFPFFWAEGLLLFFCGPKSVFAAFWVLKTLQSPRISRISVWGDLLDSEGWDVRMFSSLPI